MIERQQGIGFELSAALSYSNLPVVRRYANRMGLLESDAELHWRELMKFLVLCALSHEHYCPSKQLDEIWHEFLLHTSTYERFCTSVLGVFVHHQPTDSSECDLYQKTLIALSRRFGPLDPKVWPHTPASAADCDAATCAADCKSCEGIRTIGAPLAASTSFLEN